MRISFLLPYAGMAGGIRVVAIYAERLQKRGHEVTLISTDHRVVGRRRRTVHRIHRAFHRMRGLAEPSHLNDLDVPHRALKHCGPITDGDVPDSDIVVATWWETAHAACALSPDKGVKTYFVQDYGAHDGQPLDAVARTWTLPLHKITISRWLADLIREHAGDSDVPIVLNSVDLDLFQSPPRGKQSSPTVGFVYETRPQKGCDIMLRAVQLARESLPELKVVAFGAKVEHADLPLPADADYTQHAPDEMLGGIYSGCDAWLFGSRLEGFGLPILEAMACRTPVIATPAGAAPELLAEGGGRLVKHDDPADMARAVEEIAALSDPQWREMSDRALDTVRGYTWDDATDRFEAALEAAVARAKEPAKHISRRRLSA